jgi:choline dehydrogenase
MPTMLSANLNAGVLMIAEKGADMVLGKPPLSAA